MWRIRGKASRPASLCWGRSCWRKEFSLSETVKEFQVTNLCRCLEKRPKVRRRSWKECQEFLVLVLHTVRSYGRIFNSLISLKMCFKKTPLVTVWLAGMRRAGWGWLAGSVLAWHVWACGSSWCQHRGLGWGQKGQGRDQQAQPKGLGEKRWHLCVCIETMQKNGRNWQTDGVLKYSLKMSRWGLQLCWILEKKEERNEFHFWIY